MSPKDPRYDERCFGYQSVEPLHHREVKLDHIDLELTGPDWVPTISRVLDMLYTKASKLTTLQLSDLIVDVNLTGLGQTLPTFEFGQNRIAAYPTDNEGLGQMPKMREQSTTEIKKNFVCDSIEVKRVEDTWGSLKE